MTNLLDVLKFLAFIIASLLGFMIICSLFSMSYMFIMRLNLFWVIVCLFFVSGIVFLIFSGIAWASSWISKLNTFPSVSKFITYPLIYIIGGYQILGFWQASNLNSTKDFVVTIPFCLALATITMLYSTGINNKEEEQIIEY